MAFPSQSVDGFGDLFRNAQTLDFTKISLADGLNGFKVAEHLTPGFRTHPFDTIKTGLERILVVDLPVEGLGIAVDFDLNSLHQVEGLGLGI